MDILKMLKETGTIDQISKKYSISEDEINSVVQNSMPEIQDAIKNNTATDEGYASFLGAIQDHENDDLENMIRNVDNIDTNDGDKIMNHIFGRRKSNVNEKVSKNANSSSKNTRIIIALLLPVILSMLGKSSKNRGSYQEQEPIDRADSRNTVDRDILGRERQSGPLGGQTPGRDGRITDLRDTVRKYDNNRDYNDRNYHQQDRRVQQDPGRDGLMDIVGEVLGGSGNLDLGSILGGLFRK